MQTCMTDETRELVLSRWDDVRVLLAALRAGSFTAAATRLGSDQSTVSRRIAALEQALGVALFERTRRAPQPTEAALRLREAACAGFAVYLLQSRGADDSQSVATSVPTTAPSRTPAIALIASEARELKLITWGFETTIDAQSVSDKWYGDRKSVV